MWEDRFAAEEGYLFGTAPAAVLTDNPGLVVPGISALSVSDGEGRNSVWLAQQGMDVSAFDMSPTAVERAEALAIERGVTLEVAVSDWQSWDWSRQFDLVVGIFIQWADPDFRTRQFADMKRATKPGGRVLLHGYTPEQIAHGTGGPRNPVQLYTPGILSAAFSDWRIERLAAYERHVDEGRGHNGQSALIDLIAKRPQ